MSIYCIFTFKLNEKHNHIPWEWPLIKEMHQIALIYTQWSGHHLTNATKHRCVHCFNIEYKMVKLKCTRQKYSNFPKRSDISKWFKIKNEKANAIYTYTVHISAFLKIQTVAERGGEMTLSERLLLFFCLIHSSRGLSSLSAHSTSVQRLAAQLHQRRHRIWPPLVSVDSGRMMKYSSNVFVRITKTCFVHRGLTYQSTGS